MAHLSGIHCLTFSKTNPPSTPLNIPIKNLFCHNIKIIHHLYCIGIFRVPGIFYKFLFFLQFISLIKLVTEKLHNNDVNAIIGSNDSVKTVNN